MPGFLAPRTLTGNGKGYLAPARAPTTGSTVTGVTITPPFATLAGGAVLDFDVLVLGTGGPSQAVTWSTDLGAVDAAGSYTAPASTDDDQIATLTATSVQDDTHAGHATITILATGAAPLTCSVEFRHFRSKPMRAFRLA